MEFIGFILAWPVWGFIYLFLFFQITSFLGLVPFDIEFPNEAGYAIYVLVYSAVMIAGYLYGAVIILKIVANFEKDDDEDI
tara:strand:+ start:49 stop:291 length:243 start_codon:yes stop_codon:yes gene_type:complete